MKRFLFAVIVIIFLISFSGCSQITYGTIIKNDGNINEVVQVKLEPEKINEKGVDINLLFNEIEKEFSVWIYNKIAEGAVKGFIYDLIKDDKDYNIMLILNYEDINAYYAFWEVELTENKKQEYEFCFLYDKLKIINDKTVFYNIKNSSIAKHFYDWCETKFGQIEWDDSNFKFNYVYAIPSAFGYKTNSNIVQRVDDIDYHIWQFDLSQTDKQISVYLPVIRGRNVACLFILILFLSFIFGLVLYYKFKNKS